MLLLFLLLEKWYDFSKPRVSHVQAASRQGEALGRCPDRRCPTDRQLLSIVMKLARAVLDAKRQISFAMASRKTANVSS